MPMTGDPYGRGKLAHVGYKFSGTYMCLVFGLYHREAAVSIAIWFPSPLPNWPAKTLVCSSKLGVSSTDGGTDGSFQF